MAGYIRVHLERRDDSGRFVELPESDPLRGRSHTRFAFLAGQGNWANIVPISPPRGLPDDASASVRQALGRSRGYAASWLTVEELLSFDYGQPLRFCQDIRPPECTARTYRELLDEFFLPELHELQAIGAQRVVFWFDN